MSVPRLYMGAYRTLGNPPTTGRAHLPAHHPGLGHQDIGGDGGLSSAELAKHDARADDQGGDSSRAGAGAGEEGVTTGSRAGASRGASALVDHLPSLRADASKLCACAADAEDLVQETMARATAALGSFHTQKYPRGWFFMIMRGALSDQRSSSRRFHRGADAWFQALSGSEHAADSSEADSERVRVAMESLNVTLRLTVRLRLQQRTLREIGELLGIPTSTVSTRLMRARKVLRAVLEEAQESER